LWLPWRPSLSIADIEKIVHIVKQHNPNTICFVDNCYGEFIENREPTAVGADLIAGSLIKNPETIVTLATLVERFSGSSCLSPNRTGNRQFWCDV